MKPSKKITAIVSALILSFAVGDAMAASCRHHGKWWRHFTPHFKYVYIVPAKPSLYINKVAMTGFVAVPFAAPDRGKNLQIDTVSASRSGWLKFEVRNYATGCQASVAIPFARGYNGKIYTRQGSFPLMYHPGGCVDVSTVSVMKNRRHGYVISVN